jgi:hypothetical protein
MYLLRVAKGLWEVQAVCDAEGACPALDFLLGLQRGPYRAASDWMLQLVKQTMTTCDPRTIPMPLCRSLGDGLFEFRKQPKGKKVRLLWFVDVGRIVVCTSVFLKDDKTGPVEIERARALRRRYFEDQRMGRNHIIDLGE